MTSRTPTSSRRSATAVALLTAFALMGTACTGGQASPSAAPSNGSTSQSASPTPSDTPTPIATASYKPADAKGRAQNVPLPVLPEAAKAKTKEGAIAFAKHWFNLLSYGYETGDLRPLNIVTSDSCEPCAKAKAVINAWNTEGRWLVGGLVTTPSVSTEFVQGADMTYQVAVQAHQTPLTYMRKDGSVARRGSQPDDTGNLLFITFAKGAWKLVDIGRIVG
ncbi:DUF6318 family protein [uncultured Arthrobacter sp.]|uniref:DUF6318 family protein n=1 Tax=uncultured Arthrobacter sp. TaxID=114050 RepID=UPI003217BA29